MSPCSELSAAHSFQARSVALPSKKLREWVKEYLTHCAILHNISLGNQLTQRRNKMALDAKQLNDLRARVLAGETVTKEEMAEAIKTLRGSRASASATSTASRKSKTKTPQEAQAELDDMLGGLGL